MIHGVKLAVKGKMETVLSVISGILVISGIFLLLAAEIKAADRD